MKVRVKFAIAGKTIDEVVTGTDADDLLAQAKARAAKEMGWKGLFLNGMSPIQFAQTAVKFYNEGHKANYPVPETAADFIKFGQTVGNIEILEP